MSLFNPDLQTEVLTELLNRKLSQNEINPIDAYFSELMAKLSKTHDKDLISIFSQLSHRTSQQDSCMEVSNGQVEKLRNLESVTLIDPAKDSRTDRSRQLKTPLVLAGNKLYLQKYFQYELKIAKDLVKRNVATVKNNFETLSLLFPEKQEYNDDIDWQKLAAFQCLSRQLTIITGGPGTGKTTIIVKILAALLDQDPELRIKLAAPTGKAAARLSEAIMASSHSLPEIFSAKVPDKVSTVHRLLGMRNKGHSYQYHQENKLTIDLLILDEVSMIDLAMFTRILDALPEHCRLIMLGDPDQLLSVDTGAVMTDLYRLGQHYDKDFLDQIGKTLGYSIPPNHTEYHPLSNAFCHLRTSYRFSPELGIGKLATNIRENAELDFINDAEVNYVHEFNLINLTTELANQYQPYFNLIKQKAKASELLQKFEDTRVLSPLREGDFGIESLNSLIESSLFGRLTVPSSYHGKPIMITQNDYVLELFNGDIGICIESSDGEMKAAFHGQDAEIREVSLMRLPSWETCFAMSVHKSQGSEFLHVSLVLPPIHHAKKLFTRELIYTAVTRSRSHVTIYADAEDLKRCLAQGSNRLSGLQERILMEGADPTIEP